MTGSGYALVSRYCNGVSVDIPDTFMSGFAWGWLGRVPGTRNVRIAGGPVQLQAGIGWVEDAVVTVAGTQADPHVIYVTSGGIATATARKSEFNGHEEGEWRRPLYIVWLRSGVPVRGRAVWNIIDLKTWFSAPS